ncbi:unnamed protein product [Diplocarpon coronariae]|uniref:Uncharacterized protein n=1 Tax=Diplocarpon coronariae TaxID=2795749 RepID=A0A218YY19_9HELO|nr:hypothetical protein B2J93_3894 [Marssonina coronariae]
MRSMSSRAYCACTSQSALSSKEPLNLSPYSHRQSAQDFRFLGPDRDPRETGSLTQLFRAAQHVRSSIVPRDTSGQIFPKNPEQENQRGDLVSFFSRPEGNLQGNIPRSQRPSLHNTTVINAKPVRARDSVGEGVGRHPPPAWTAVRQAPREELCSSGTGLDGIYSKILPTSIDVEFQPPAMVDSVAA